jgi:nitronate monooxygenase
MAAWNLGSHTVKVPIVQGGMGVGVSLAGLASAVAREGGVGIMAAVGLAWDNLESNTSTAEDHKIALQAEIAKARKLAPDGIIGVNVMMALSNADDLMIAAAEAGAHALFIGAGLPLAIPQRVLDFGTTVALVPIVSSGRAAKIIRDTWLKKYNRAPDAFVVEGPKAGGHLGFKNTEINSKEHALENILIDVLAVSRDSSSHIPVIAAGGIFSAEDVSTMLSLGATAVQLGTRFVATEECDASKKFKESYINSAEKDIEIIASPVGLPGRAIRSPFLTSLESGERRKTICRFRCLRTCNPATTPYCIARALISAKRGDFEQGFAFCGSNAHRIEKIVTVRELMHELMGTPQMADTVIG